MDNQFFLVDAYKGLQGRISPMHSLKELLDSGKYEIKRCYTTDNVFIFHIAEREEEEAVSEPVVESVIEVALDDNPDTVKAYTDAGWIPREYYSKRVQLIKYREVEVNEE